jgi:hypothetical protein
MSEQNLVDAPDHFGGDGFEVEEFDGGNEGGGPSAPGMGQSKSSRRRRRKRKNKLVGAAPAAEGSAPGATEDAAVPPTTIVMEGESLALAAGAAGSAGNTAQPVRRPQQSGQQPFGQGQGQGGKRWKKKFRDRERRTRNDNPGNESRSDNAGNSGGGYSHGGGYAGGNGYRQSLPDNFGNLAGGFKRKNKGGGHPKDRGFVGPMDHSYRAGDANYADSPPSTIQLHGHRRHRHQGDNQPLDFSGPRPVPIPEDAQTHIYLFVEDLFLTAKISETARKLGVKVAFVKNDKEALAELTSGEDTNKPALIVFDLNNANAKPLTTIPKLKTKLKRTVSIIGFLSHLQGDLKAKAVEAGCDVVMPRAAFSQNLPNLLRRYGVETVEEVNFNY